MGVLGAKGLFQNTSETTLRVLLLNKDSLLSVFQTLLNELEAAEVSTPRLSLRSSQKGSDKIFNALQQKFSPRSEDVNKEVSRLIQQATDNSNLAQMFPGT
jgi:phosphatidylinositol kinase/protein kinase (PI-3  family)